MSDRAELEALIRTQIEEPAGHRILEMVRTGLIEQADADLFSTSAQRYKAAVLAEYDSFDPRVRDELRKSLLTDYQNEIERLIKDVAARSTTADPNRKPIGDAEHRAQPQLEPADTAKHGTRSSAPGLLGKVRDFLFAEGRRPPR
jgi:hypothetical protein